ncbi:MAG: lipopolysaccharide biosynthesis protein [Myxococcales bacterium]|nr:lipopolysaccharide biosynthesis protein [Myxococcales bacterium]
MEARDKGTALGQGGLSLGVAKLFFLVAGYVVSVALAGLLTPKAFGQYRVVSDLVAVPNMVLIQSLLFAVSRPMSAVLAAGEEQQRPIYAGLRRRGFVMALGLGGLVTVVFLLGAELLARLYFQDPATVTPLRVVAPIPLIYAMYAVNVGTLNATRRFHLQATLDIFMAATKTGLMLAAAAVGFGLGGVMGGFTGASLLALTLSTVFIAWSQGEFRGGGNGSAENGRVVLPAMARFTGLLLVFTGVVNLLVAADLLILQKFVTSEAQKDLVGFYSSANLVARVPYSIMVAVSLVMFPLVATLHARQDQQQISRYVSATTRVCVVLLAFMSAVGASAAPEVQRLLFPAAYGQVAAELRYLVWGLSGYSLTVTAAWICNSNHQSRLALLLVGLPLATVAVSGWLLVPQAFTSGAAMAVAIAGGVGAAAALAVLYRFYGARLSPGFVLKLAGAIAAVELAARVWTPGGKLGILIKLVGLAAVFGGVVLGSRAVTVAEVKGLRRVR